MSKEFREGDRVKIDKNLTYTTPRFGTVREMEAILTGTVTHDSFQKDDEVVVTLDYPYDVPEGHRISYSYDPRDLTLISKKEDKEKGNETMLKAGDRVTIKSLKYTKERFDLTSDMASIFTGTVKRVDKEDNRATVKLDGVEYFLTYDLRDLTDGFPTPTSVKTSKNKTTVTFSDGSTTSVTKSAGDPYDLETAIAYCIAKKFVTNSHIKHLAKNAEEVVDKVTTEFYNKFLKPYGFLNETAYTDVEIETLKNYLKTLNDVRADLALIAIEKNLTKDELLGKLRG